MLFDFFFPRRCLGCGQWEKYFCEKCLQKLKPIENQVCPVCRRPAFEGKTHADCQTKYSLDGLMTIFGYQGMIKEAIGKLKYKFVTDLANELIGLIPRQRDYFQSFLLVPLPLHSRRQRWRGFNQAELLGEKLAKKFNWQMETNLLVRHRHAQPQMKLKGKERKQNIRGAFKINPDFKRSKIKSKFILFDDVWTTGSTLKEAGKVLKRAGAKEVWGLALAR